MHIITMVIDRDHTSTQQCGSKVIGQGSKYGQDIVIGNVFHIMGSLGQMRMLSRGVK